MLVSFLTRILALSAAALLLTCQVSAKHKTSRVNLASDGTEANGDSTGGSVSADGRFVVFESAARNLVAGDTNARYDIFLKDLSTGVVRRVSLSNSGLQGNGDSTDPFISGDGRFVSFTSFANNFVANDTNGGADVFVVDTLSGQISRESVSTSGTEGDNWSASSCLSYDGRYVVYNSQATNLVGNDTNARYDVFLRDRSLGITTRVSLDSQGAQGNGDSTQAAISQNAAIITFTSVANNLVIGDTNNARDVFAHRIASGETTRISVSSNGDQGNAHSEFSSVSADGRFVAFQSYATNFVTGDTNNDSDAFVRDLQASTTVRASLGVGGVQGDRGVADCVISPNARFLVFGSNARNLVQGDTNNRVDVFRRDLLTGIVNRVSVSSHFAQGNEDSGLAYVNSDARVITFMSFATNLVPGDTNLLRDVFAWREARLETKQPIP